MSPSTYAQTILNSNVVELPKPKRPLSSYNIFYRFKRQKTIEMGGNVNKDDIITLVRTPPGTESSYPSPPADATPSELNEIRRTNIRTEMLNNLLPRETSRRRHRKNTNAFNGEMNFLELSKLMNTAWTSCDEFAKSIFNELADTGRESYKVQIAEWNIMNNERTEKHHATMIAARQAAMVEASAAAGSNVRRTTMGEVYASGAVTVTPNKNDQQHQEMMYNTWVAKNNMTDATRNWLHMHHLFTDDNENTGGGGGNQNHMMSSLMMNTQGQGQDQGEGLHQEGSMMVRRPTTPTTVSPPQGSSSSSSQSMSAGLRTLEDQLEAAKLRLRIMELEAEQVKRQNEMKMEMMNHMQAQQQQQMNNISQQQRRASSSSPSTASQAWSRLVPTPASVHQQDGLSFLANAASKTGPCVHSPSAMLQGGANGANGGGGGSKRMNIMNDDSTHSSYNDSTSYQHQGASKKQRLLRYEEPSN